MRCLELNVRVAICLLAAGMVGCGSAEKVKNRKPVFPVSGQFLFYGAPAGGAMISFHPLGDAGPGRAIPSQALSDTEGKFALTTYSTADGAPEGDYVVTIYWPAARLGGEAAHDGNGAEDGDDADDGDGELPPDRLRGRFASPGGSKLRAHVDARPMTLAPLDLGASELAGGGEFMLREP